MQNVFLFLSVGLVAINLILMEFMQNTIEKEERIKIAVLTEQNQKNRIADYQDREEIYERQRRKMHDYKNQLSTIQTLIKNGHTDEALSFTQKLTESIAVEMSAINTNHPVVNAVLNQKYRSMQEKHIAVILKVGDLQEICLEEEEIVILLSNLLDNAIRESEKVLKNTGKAVIHLKLECEEHKLIFAVRNPVTEKVEIENDTIKSKRGDHHGIGLLNVKAVVDKYGGDMVLSCDEDYELMANRHTKIDYEYIINLIQNIVSPDEESQDVTQEQKQKQMDEVKQYVEELRKDNPKVAEIMTTLIGEIEQDVNKYKGQSILNIVENMKQECIEKVVTDFCITWYTSKDDVMYAAMHYRNGEIPNESAIKETANFTSYKEVQERAIPKFKYYTMMIAELRKTLDEEIKPLMNH